MPTTSKKICYLLACILVMFAACSKSKDGTSEEAHLQATVTQDAADAYTVQSGEDDITADVNAAVVVNPSFSASSSSSSNDSAIITGAVVDYSGLTDLTKRIRIIYHGAVSTIQSGTITVELIQGTSWIEAGAELKITVDSLRMMTLIGPVVYNGTCYLTNLSGGLPYLSSTNPVVHKVRVNGTASFADNSKVIWWAARKNSFFETDASFHTEGDTLINGESCSMGGMNRFNTGFLVKAPEAIVSNATCGFDKPVSGKRTFSIEGHDSFITFGVDNYGSPITLPGCAYGYKVTWKTWAGNDATLVVSY